MFMEVSAVIAFQFSESLRAKLTNMVQIEDKDICFTTLGLKLNGIMCIKIYK